MSEDTTNLSKIPPRPRLAVRLLRKGLFVVACLATVIAFLYVEENWRGKRAWENYKREWEAKGEKFDLASFVPPPVPDEENFAMTPFLAPLFDLNPRPLQPDQSPWRDTNAANRAMSFLSKLKEPEWAGDWTKTRQTFLTAWVEAQQKKTNGPESTKPTLSRTEAATEVLRILEPYRPVMDELQTASRRPYARFNIHYTDKDQNPAAILLPHLAVVKRTAMIFQLRASAELALGRMDEAWADVKTALYIGDSVKDEPFLISGLVRIAVLRLSLERPVWDGLAGHQWSDAQLAELEQRLGGIDMLAEYGHGIRGERGLHNTGLEYLRTHRKELNNLEESATPFFSWVIPSGWFYQNQLVLNRLHQEINLPQVDAAKHRVYPAGPSGSEDALINQELYRGFPPYRFFARLLFPKLAKAQMKFAHAQTLVDEAMVACALERYRLAHGEFPQTLDALVPQFIQKIPNDVFTGEPLKYQRNADGRFLLYSVGWNGTDDGGQVVRHAGSSGIVDLTKGDWVWPPESSTAYTISE
jgi:hypothetical protein